MKDDLFNRDVHLHVKLVDNSAYIIDVELNGVHLYNYHTYWVDETCRTLTKDVVSGLCDRSMLNEKPLCSYQCVAQ